MNVLGRLFNFYINSSFHVALAVVALAMVTSIEFQIEPNRPLLFFIFFASICGYNFVKFYGLVKFHHRSLTNWLKLIQLMTLFCFVMMVYFLFKLNVTVISIIAVLGLITFLYAIPVFPRRVVFDRHQNLRQIGGLKVYIIALVWVAVTVILPLKEANLQIDFDVTLTVIQRFILVVVLMLPFEIRDLNYDTLKLATIPQKIGVKNTKLLGGFLLGIVLILELFKDDISVTYLCSLIIFLIITSLFLLLSRKDQSQYYSAFWVEMLPIVWLVLLLGVS